MASIYIFNVDSKIRLKERFMHSSINSLNNGGREISFKKVSFLLRIGILLFTICMSAQKATSQIAQRGAATSATSTSATVTINKPAGVVSGDIMIANIGNYINATQASATCTGWTLIAGTDVDRGRATLLYKIAGASEPATYTFSVTNSSTAATGAIIAFSGVNTANPFDVTAANSWNTATLASLSNIPSITTVTNNSAVVMFGNCSRITSTTGSNFLNDNWTLTSPSPLTEIYDVGHNSVANTPSVGAAWAIKSTAGATGNGGLNCNVNTNPRLLAGILIALRPCVPGSASISYSGSPYCSSLTTGQAVTRTGTAGGTYTASPAGLSINSSTGAITPSTSTPGTYTITYTIAPTGGCSAVTATTSVTIASPTANTGAALPSICVNGNTSLSGSVSGTATGGIWSSNAGGSFNPNATTLNATYAPPNGFTGPITLTLTTSGGSCGTTTASTSFQVNPQPTASISYSTSSLCKNANSVSASIIGTSGGVFSASPAGLSINSATGLINPVASNTGSYTVTYTIAAANGCNAISATANITIVQDNYVFTYPSLSYCIGSTASISVSQQTAPAGGSYSASPAGLDINAGTGQINLSNSLPGNYLVKYQFSGGLCSNTDSTNINIVALPAVSCPANSGTCSTASPFTLTGATPLGGTYSGNGVSGGVFNPSNAGIGIQTITYTFTNSNGCSASCSFTINVSDATINATATASNTYVYSGNYATITLNSSVPGTQYTWTATANNPSVTGYSAQSVPTPNSINQQLFNASPLIGQVTYTITPSLVGCTGNPMTVVINLPSSTFCESPGTFQRGSCIIDMGVVPQTYNNGLKPYGLVYQLLNVNKIPVYWAISQSKSFGTNPLNKIDDADFTVDGVTYKGGAFIIPASFIGQVQSVINSWVSQGVVVRYSNTSFTPPIYELLTRIPNAVLDSRNGATIQAGFYARAGIPVSAYTLGGVPTNIANCDDIYVLPHAEPELWTQTYKDSLLNFVNNRGWLYSSCRAVSAIESNVGMNFLSTTGLLLDNQHVDGTPPYAYSLQSGLEAPKVAADPFMQSVGKLDDAVDWGAETIFLPKTTWRSSTKIAIYDSNYVNSGITYPNNAAVLAYGKAFGNTTKGLIVYLAGHDLDHGVEAANVAAARIFGNFLLRSGITARPTIIPVSVPATANSGEVINLSVSIPATTSPIVSTSWSSDLNGIFSSQGPITTFTPPVVDVTTLCTVQFKVTDACGRVGLYCTTILITPTITNNYIGSSQTICSGTSPATLLGTLPTTPGNRPFNYLWLMSTTDASTGFSAAPGVNNTQNYSPPVLTQNTWFRRQVTSNNLSVFSTSIQITVTPGPGFSIQPNPLGQSVCAGGALDSLRVFSTEAGVTYQWYSNTVAANSGGSIISGAVNAAYLPSSALPGTTYFYCIVSSSNGCKTSSNVSGAISINNSLLVTTQYPNGRQVICQGTSLVLSVLPVGAGITYQWYRSVDSTTATASRRLIAGATSSTYTPDTLGGFYYYCRVYAANNGCATQVAFSIVSPLITVIPLPSPGIVNLTGTNTITCEVKDILLQATGGISYLWNNSLGTSDIVDVDTSGIYTVTVTGTNGCKKDSSITINWGIFGSTWTGEDDSRWGYKDNWCGGVPNENSDVYIPAGTPNSPVISFAMAKAKNITISSGADLSFDGQTLQLYGNLVNSGLVYAANGTIELKGNTPQQIAGSMFVSNILGNLKISNPNGVSFSGINDTLKLKGTLSFGTGNATLNTNGNLTLLSDAFGTARVADMTSDGLYQFNRIIGDVTVERYIPNHTKAWQLLSVPTSGTRTINSAWQEGNASLSNANNPGYGTIITSNLGGNSTANAALGFDLYTPAGSTMKSYNAADSSWTGVSATNIPIANNKGYMLFVRGDRSVTAYNQAATATKLRTTGLLYQSFENPPADITVAANRFESVGNPFASAIDLSKLTRTGGIQDVYYVWDPKLTSLGVNSSYGLGGYQTIVRSGSSYTVVPGGGSYTAGNINIESGQAFLVRANGIPGTVSFAENQKTSGGALVTRSNDILHELSVKLSVMYTGVPVLIDGALSQYADDYNNEIDADDAFKITGTTNENISILHSGNKLVAEKKQTLVTGDTIFYNISQLKRLTYQLEFNELNLLSNGLTAEVVDKFTGLHTIINTGVQTIVSFTVSTDPASFAADRFYVVLRQAAVLPVSMYDISAKRNADKSVTVNWKSDHEINLLKYTIERSLDGLVFAAIKNVMPQSNNGTSFAYNTIDVDASKLKCFYRIKAISINGMVQYSKIVEVKALDTKTGVTVYPNPVENKTINLLFENMPIGDYQFKLYNNQGQLVEQFAKTLQNNSSTIKLVSVKDLPPGTYRMDIISSDGIHTAKNILIK
jgi:hypothetical protein